MSYISVGRYIVKLLGKYLAGKEIKAVICGEGNYFGCMFWIISKALRGIAVNGGVLVITPRELRHFSVRNVMQHTQAVGSVINNPSLLSNNQKQLRNLY